MSCQVLLNTFMVAYDISFLVKGEGLKVDQELWFMALDVFVVAVVRAVQIASVPSPKPPLFHTPFPPPACEDGHRADVAFMGPSRLPLRPLHHAQREQV